MPSTSVCYYTDHSGLSPLLVSCLQILMVRTLHHPSSIYLLWLQNDSLLQPHPQPSTFPARVLCLCEVPFALVLECSLISKVTRSVPFPSLPPSIRLFHSFECTWFLSCSLCSIQGSLDSPNAFYFINCIHSSSLCCKVLWVLVNA